MRVEETLLAYFQYYWWLFCIFCLFDKLRQSWGFCLIGTFVNLESRVTTGHQSDQVTYRAVYKCYKWNPNKRNFQKRKLRHCLPSNSRTWIFTLESDRPPSSAFRELYYKACNGRAKLAKSATSTFPTPGMRKWHFLRVTNQLIHPSRARN